MNKRKNVMVVAGLLACTVFNVHANDAPLVKARIVEQSVRFDDLNLAKPAGAATLHWRLRVAAHNVCVKAGQRRFACRAQALDRVLSELPASMGVYHAQWMAGGARWLQMPPSQPQLRVTAAR